MVTWIGKNLIIDGKKMSGLLNGDAVITFKNQAQLMSGDFELTQASPSPWQAGQLTYYQSLGATTKGYSLKIEGTPSDVRGTIRQINDLLFGHTVEVTLGDDPDWHYKGTLATRYNPDVQIGQDTARMTAEGILSFTAPEGEEYSDIVQSVTPFLDTSILNHDTVKDGFTLQVVQGRYHLKGKKNKDNWVDLYIGDKQLNFKANTDYRMILKADGKGAENLEITIRKPDFGIAYMLKGNQDKTVSFSQEPAALSLVFRDYTEYDLWFDWCFYKTDQYNGNLSTVKPMLSSSGELLYDFGGELTTINKVRPKITIDFVGANSFVRAQTAKTDLADGNQAEINKELNTLIDYHHGKMGDFLARIKKEGSINDAKDISGVHSYKSRGADGDFIVGDLDAGGVDLSDILKPAKGKGWSSLSLPLKTTGVMGAEVIWWRSIYWAANFDQKGRFKITLEDQNGDFMYSYEIAKNLSGAKANVYWWVGKSHSKGKYPNGDNFKLLSAREISPTHITSQNQWSAEAGWCQMQREGNTLGFYWYGGMYKFDCPELEGRYATKINFLWDEFDDAARIEHNALREIVVQNTESKSLSDVTNPFKAGDQIVIDSAKRQYAFNNILSAGRLLDGFSFPYLSSDNQQLKLYFSQYIKNYPSVKVDYAKRRY